jgi:apolipoprotein N-acyltransferase
LLALSFPRFGHSALAWIALAPLLASLTVVVRRRAAAPRHSSRRAFTLGLLSGFVYFVGTIYWTSQVMSQYGDLPTWVAVLLMLALAAYLALYPAIFAVVIERLRRAFGPAALLLAPAVWVTTELARTYVFTGFPWVVLGYSQATVLPIAQLASLVGVYGVSALVVLVNVAFVASALASARWRWWAVGVTVVAVAGTALWGSARIADGALTRSGTPFRVALVQGNVAQDQKWDQARAATILQTYLDLSLGASARGARLIIWPESSLPFLFQEDPAAGDALRLLAFRTHSYLLFGSDQIERQFTPPRYFNSAFLLDPAGTVAGVYRKMHLVPFGEYVPVKRLLFFAGPLVAAVSDFSAGEQMVMMPVAGHPTSTAICYEVVYPDLARQATARGSQLLTTITNDAWFGRSSAPWQHFEQATLRAIEQGRYLARAANTGISGIVDPYGRVVLRSGIFEQAVLVGEIRFLTDRTVYARTGDLFAYLCAILTLGALLVAARSSSAWRPVLRDR